MTEIPTIPEPSDEEILIDGERVGNFTVRPWTIPKCAEMTPIFEAIYLEMKKRRLNFKDLFDATTGKIELLNIDQLFFVVMPFAPEIICKTLDIEPKDLKGVPQDEMFNLMAVITRQNVGYIKNLFALTMQAVMTIASSSSGQSNS